MKTKKVYIIEFRNSEGKRGAVTYTATTIKKAFDTATTIKKAFDTACKDCKARGIELIGVREA